MGGCSVEDGCLVDSTECQEIYLDAGCILGIVLSIVCSLGAGRRTFVSRTMIKYIGSPDSAQASFVESTAQDSYKEHRARNGTAEEAKHGLRQVQYLTSAQRWRSVKMVISSLTF